MIFRYPGGKSKKSVKQKIFNHFPKNYIEYREPFCGGGSIFFSVPIEKKRWVNDLNSDLISVYQALKNDPQEFIKKCRSIQPAQDNESLTSSKPNGKAIYNKRLKAEFDRLIHERHVDPALSYFFINRTVFMGRVNYDIPSRLYYSNPNGWNITQGTALEEAAEILKNTKISCENYLSLLEKPGEEVVIYCDPPYYLQSKTTASSRLYQHCFTKEDHIQFHAAATSCKHKICISLDDDSEGFIKNLYKNFNIYDEEWTYCGSKNSINNTKKKGKELIIKNY